MPAGCLGPSDLDHYDALRRVFAEPEDEPEDLDDSHDIACDCPECLGRFEP